MDPFSIATGALAVASAGIKLADTLKTYINSVRKAEKQLKPILDHVKLTSDVLANVGALLKNEEIRQLYTAELLASTNDALQGCKGAFEDLDNFINKLLKPDENGVLVLLVTAKLTFNFKQKELDVLQAHLERFKSLLDLVLGVLNLASAARTAKDNAALLSMKLDLHQLIQAEQEAKTREAALESTASERELRDNPNSKARSEPTSRALPETVSFVVMNPTTPKNNIQQDLEQNRVVEMSDATAKASSPQADDELLACLTSFAEATSQLTAEIERAMSRWKKVRKYEPRCLNPAFRNTRKAIEALAVYESLELDASLQHNTNVDRRDSEIGKSEEHRRTFSERLAYLRSQKQDIPKRTDRRSPSRRERSPSSLMEASPPSRADFVRPPSGHHEWIAEDNESDEAAYSPVEDQDAFQAAMGFAGLGFGGNYVSSDNESAHSLGAAPVMNTAPLSNIIMPSSSGLPYEPEGVSVFSKIRKLLSFDTTKRSRSKISQMPDRTSEPPQKIMLSAAPPLLEQAHSASEIVHELGAVEWTPRKASVQADVSEVDNLLRRWTNIHIFDGATNM